MILQGILLILRLRSSSNYAFNLILKEKDNLFLKKLIKKFNAEKIEFRQGSAGGGNQLRQPYLNGIVPNKHHEKYPITEHVHFYGFYLGNFPNLNKNEIQYLCRIINSI